MTAKRDESPPAILEQELKSCDSCLFGIPPENRYKTVLADGLCSANNNERCLFVKFNQGGDCKDYLSRHNTATTEQKSRVPVEIYL